MASLFTVQTSSGTQLWADAGTGQVFAAPAATVGAGTAALVVIPNGTVGIAFLVAADSSTSLRIGIDLIGGHVLPLRLQRERGSDEAAFCHPFSGGYLSAGPPSSDLYSSAITIRGTERLATERFALAQVTDCPLSLAATLKQLDQWASVSLTGPAFLDRIEAGIQSTEGTVFDAYARLLPVDEVTWLASVLLQSGRAVANLAAALSGDPFAAEALPALARWMGPRTTVARLQLTTAQDDLTLTGIYGAYASFPHMCNAHARRLTSPRRTIAVLATARNEGLYLMEWIAHHRSIGVEHFFIYSNDNTDGSDRLLHMLAQAGVITWIDNRVAPGRTAQFQAYGHAFGTFPEILDYRWTLVIDLDEFLCLEPSRFASLPDYMAWQEARPVDAVAFNWVVFGSSGETAWRDAPVTARFVHRMPHIDRHVKTMVRTHQALHARPHHPVFDSRQATTTRNASGGMHLHEGDPSLSLHPEGGTAWINHYLLKSAEEYVWKASRNRGDEPLVLGAEPTGMNTMFADLFLNQHTSPTMLHDPRIQAGAAALAAETERLMALPGVAEAMEAVRSVREQQAARFRRLMQDDPVFQTPGTLQNRLGALIGL